MNLDQLTKSFEGNKVPVLATAAAGVVAFALYQRKKTPAGPAPAQGVTTTGGVYSAGGQVAGANGAAAYDSTSSDVYGLVQPQLESLGQQLTGLSDKLNAVPVSTPTATSPLAASMYAPDPNNKNWGVLPNGVTVQVQSDGSLFGSTADQFFTAGGGTVNSRTPYNTNLNYYSTESNVADAAKRAAASSTSS